MNSASQGCHVLTITALSLYWHRNLLTRNEPHFVISPIFLTCYRMFVSGTHGCVDLPMVAH